MKCSVIVPTYNRLQYLKRTLESLLQQDFHDMEILVVDDGSFDGTAQYLDEMKNTLNIAVIHQKNQGPAAARNAGIQAAKGEIIAFTDDDCIVPRNWIRKYDEVFNETDIGFAGGTVVNMVKNNIFSQMSQEIANQFVCFYGADGKSTAFLTSNNIAYRSNILQMANGFDTCFQRPGGEERALNHRILNMGIRGVLISDLTIEHYHVMNFRRYFRQQRNYGRGSFILFNIICPKHNITPSPVSKAAYFSLVKSWFKINPFVSIFKIFLFMITLSQNLTGYFLESFAWNARKDQS